MSRCARPGAQPLLLLDPTVDAQNPKKPDVPLVLVILRETLTTLRLKSEIRKFLEGLWDSVHHYFML